MLAVAIPVLDEEQVQLAASPATPPEALTANTTLLPTATSAEAGAMEATSGARGGGGGGTGVMTSTSSPHAATPSARSPAIRKRFLTFKSPSAVNHGPPRLARRHPKLTSFPYLQIPCRLSTGPEKPCRTDVVAT